MKMFSILHIDGKTEVKADAWYCGGNEISFDYRLEGMSYSQSVELTDISTRPEQMRSLIIILDDNSMGRAYYTKLHDTFYTQLVVKREIKKWCYLPTKKNYNHAIK